MVFFKKDIFFGDMVVSHIVLCKVNLSQITLLITSVHNGNPIPCCIPFFMNRLKPVGQDGLAWWRWAMLCTEGNGSRAACGALRIRYFHHHAILVNFFLLYCSKFPTHLTLTCCAHYAKYLISVLIFGIHRYWEKAFPEQTTMFARSDCA